MYGFAEKNKRQGGERERERERPRGREERKEREGGREIKEEFGGEKKGKRGRETGRKRVFLWGKRSMKKLGHCAIGDCSGDVWIR